MADQRITGINWSPEGGTLNPPAYGEPLNATRCAALHNHLIERGLQSSGQSTSDIQSQSWWDVYGSHIDSVATKLHPAVQDFLKQAWISWDGTSSPGQLFWNITNIPPPEDLFGNAINQAHEGLTTLDHDMYDELDDEDYEDDPEDDPALADLDLEQYRFLKLYTSHTSGNDSPPVGVVFDQKRQVAVFVSSEADVQVLVNGHNTFKFNCLEHVLDAWHLLMDREKVTRTDGAWKMQPFGQQDLVDSIRAWDDLVSHIESTIVRDEGTLLQEGDSRTLLDPRNAMSLHMSAFRRQFLTSARRPRFKWIAPGMKVPSSDELASRIRALSSIAEDIRPENGEPPLLLFEIDLPSFPPTHYRSSITNEVSLTDPNIHETLFRFAKNLDPSTSFPPGLYLSSTGSEETPYSDSCRLILPFPLGFNGFVRRSDFTWDLGDREAIDVFGNKHFNTAPRYSELYQLGNGITRTILQHDAQLYKLFGTWKRQVQFGTAGWAVNAEGVIGTEAGEIKGITAIEEHADSWERFGNYTVSE